MNELIPTEIIEQRIFLIRCQKVMVDRDLAKLYEVPTKALNQAVKRNIERFPEDFMFRLTQKETKELVTNCDRFINLKHSTAFPAVFTDYGVAMLSSVLRSRRAVRINVQIIKTFIKIRQALVANKEFAEKLEVLEKRIAKNEIDIQTVAEVIRDFLEIRKEEKPKVKIGFSPTG